LRVRFDRANVVASMRAAWAIVWVLPGLMGCNALTGASDLEPVDCIDCIDSALVDSVSNETSAADTMVLEVASDANDASDAAETDEADAPEDTRRRCERDSDCDDGNACTSDRCVLFMNMCRNFILDTDGDGESSSTLGACGLDCNDNNKEVFSKQTAFFTSSYPLPSGLASYDYNCDRRDEPQYTDIYRCTLVGGTCVFGGAGWIGSVPACGRVAKWATGCAKSSFTACIPFSADRTQPCR
jgi:hypothetical protein